MAWAVCSPVSVSLLFIEFAPCVTRGSWLPQHRVSCIFAFCLAVHNALSWNVTCARRLPQHRRPLVVLLALVAMAAEGAPDTAAAVAKPTTAELNARPGRTLTERAHEAERRIVQKYNEHNASVADRFPKTGKTLTERAADAERKIAARYAVANDANAHNFPKTGKSLMERAAEAEKKRRENKAVTYGKKPE